MPHLVEWDRLDLRVSGEKLNELVQSFRVEPIERMQLRFTNGLLRVEGSVRKFFSVPFSVDIGEMTPRGSTVRVPVRSAAAFGGIPIPRFLFAMVKDQLPRDVVRFEEPATFVISLDRFLPTYVVTDIQEIWIVDGGLSVTLGRGGADVPPPIPGGTDGPGNKRQAG